MRHLLFFLARLVPLNAVLFCAVLASGVRAEAPYLPVWTKLLDGNNAFQVNAVAVDSNGNPYVSGRMDVPGLQGTNADAFVRKYDAAGNVIWTRQIDGGFPAADESASVAIDVFGNAFTVG